MSEGRTDGQKKSLIEAGCALTKKDYIESFEYDKRTGGLGLEQHFEILSPSVFHLALHEDGLHGDLLGGSDVPQQPL